MAKKTFLYGAVLLTAAGAFSKLLGLIFRLPLTNIIGDEAMGYYSAVYPVYVLLLTVSIAGFPVAISRMVSERLTFGDHYGAHRVFRVSLAIMTMLGTSSCIVLFLVSRPLSRALANLDDAVYGMRAIAPALFFVTVMSAFMGYFQGMRNMRPTAAVQVTEQLFRVIAGLSLAIVLLDRGPEFAAAGANFGATAGAFAGFALILAVYIRKVRKPGFREQIEASKRTFGSGEQPLPKILKALFSITIPIMIGASIMPIMSNIDLALVTNRLSVSGWDPVAVRSMYAHLSSFAGSIVNLPQAVTQAIAISLVPTVISAFKTRDHEFLEKNVTMSMRMTMLISLPCAVGVGVLAEPILKLLYFKQIDAAIGAAPSLTILSVGIVFLTLIQTQTGILQGVERQWLPMRNLFIGALVKSALTFTLTGIPQVNIRGAAAGTVAAYMVAALLDYRAIRKYTKTRIEWKLVLLRPFISAAVMGACAFGAYTLCHSFVGNSISALAGVGTGVVVYAIMVFVTGAVTRDELAILPKSGKLLKVYDTFSRKGGR
jgi:stage V sporulation protein B